MPLAPLDRLVATGKLKTEAPAKAELVSLLHSGEVRLKDASKPSLAIESRFDLAYNAAHSFSLAALRFHGYRSENRYLVFQTLAHTVDLSAEQWRVLDDAHRRRNAAEYEGIINIDESLVSAIVRVAGEVGRRVRKLVSTMT